jgi:hypothetical protein
MKLFANVARATLFGRKQNNALTFGNTLAASIARLFGMEAKDKPTVGQYAYHVGVRTIQSAFGIRDERTAEGKLPLGWPRDVFSIVAKEVESKGGLIKLDDGATIPAFRLTTVGAIVLPHLWIAYIKPNSQYSDYKKVGSLDESIEESLAQKGKALTVRVMSKPLRVEIDRPDAEIIRLSDDWALFQAQPQNRYEYVFGTYFNGKTLVAGVADLLDSNECHAVIAGATGSGKSQTSLTILLSAMLNTSPEKLSVIICDPKNKDFRPLANAAHVGGKIYTEVEDCKAAILAVLDEMDKRNSEGDDPAELRRILLYIDELPDLLDHDDGTIEAALIRLGQKATKEVFSTRLLDNMTWRMVLRVTSSIQSVHLSGTDGCFAHKLPGKGAGLFYNAEFPGGVRVQGHLVADPKHEDYTATLQRFVADINERWAGKRPHWTVGSQPRPEMVQAELIAETPTINTKPGRPRAQWSEDFLIAVMRERVRLGDEFNPNVITKLYKEMHGDERPNYDRVKELYARLVS